MRGRRAPAVASAAAGTLLRAVSASPRLAPALSVDEHFAPSAAMPARCCALPRIQPAFPFALRSVPALLLGHCVLPPGLSRPTCSLHDSTCTELTAPGSTGVRGVLRLAVAPATPRRCRCPCSAVRRRLTYFGAPPPLPDAVARASAPRSPRARGGQGPSGAPS